MGVRLVIRSAEDQALDEEIAYGFEQGRIVIGRGPGADVRIPHLTVSETHAVIQLDGHGYAIVDHDSKNGTLVNQKRIAPQRKKRLTDGDRLQIGVYVLSFHSAVALSNAITSERTAELARRLFRRSVAGAGLAGPRLVRLNGPDIGMHLDVPPPPSRLLIGREAGCQLVLPESDVRPEHAELVRDLDGVLVRALEPEAEIAINGQPSSQRRLRDGDELDFAGARLLFEDPAEERIDHLTGEHDRPLEPASLTAGERNPADPAGTRAPEHGGEASAPVANQPATFDADLLIYALAAVVIAVSVAGLLALIGVDW